jgi:hypothetical protein
MLMQANAQLTESASWLPTHMSAADDLDHSAPTAYPSTPCSHVAMNVVHSATGRCPVLCTSSLSGTCHPCSHQGAPCRLQGRLGWYPQQSVAGITQSGQEDSLHLGLKSTNGQNLHHPPKLSFKLHIHVRTYRDRHAAQLHQHSSQSDACARPSVCE